MGAKGSVGKYDRYKNSGCVRGSAPVSKCKKWIILLVSIIAVGAGVSAWRYIDSIEYDRNVDTSSVGYCDPANNKTGSCSLKVALKYARTSSSSGHVNRSSRARAMAYADNTFDRLNTPADYAAFVEGIQNSATAIGLQNEEAKDIKRLANWYSNRSAEVFASFKAGETEQCPDAIEFVEWKTAAKDYDRRTGNCGSDELGREWITIWIDDFAFVWTLNLENPAK